jgi:hypothetical protein
MAIEFQPVVPGLLKRAWQQSRWSSSLPPVVLRAQQKNSLPGVVSWAISRIAPIELAPVIVLSM